MRTRDDLSKQTAASQCFHTSSQIYGVCRVNADVVIIETKRGPSCLVGDAEQTLGGRKLCKVFQTSLPLPISSSYFWESPVIPNKDEG